MTNKSPYYDYMHLLSEAEFEADRGNYQIAKEKLNEYKQLKQENDASFQQEIDYRAESGRGITAFIYDSRCMSIDLLESLCEKVKEINQKIAKAKIKN